jgi:glucose/arabinose dehydrogenase
MVRFQRIPILQKQNICFGHLICFLLFTSMSLAVGPETESKAHNFRVHTLVEGLQNPWSLAFLPDGRMLVTERPGRLRVINQGKLEPQPVQGLPSIAARGQGGLLDVALHPQFEDNQLVYLSYVAIGDGGIGTEVARGRLTDNRLENVETIFRMQPKSSTERHFGSRLIFGPDGYLYITLGDRGETDRAQQSDDHAGSVIRLHDDGRVPEDNPFVSREGWKPEIYTIGNRNVQGVALHPRTGDIWFHEHGPRGGDEVNILRGGANYGWPVITYGKNYVTRTQIGEGTHKEGMEQPLHYWVPTSIAPSGMAFYTGDKFPDWQGDLFVGALAGQMLVRLRFEGKDLVEEEHLLKGELGRIRDVRIGPDGLIYLLTDHGNGVLARLEPVEARDSE